MMRVFKVNEIIPIQNNCSSLTENTNVTNLSMPVCIINSDGKSVEYSFGAEHYGLLHLLSTSIILGLIILVTIIGNVFVIAAIILERNLHNVANYLIASLSVADLMVAALVMPITAVNEVSKRWFLGPEICDMWSSLDVLCCTSSILHLVAIAVDRYWAVSRVDYVQNRSAPKIICMIVMIWVCSVCISVPPLFGWKKHEDHPAITGQCMISQELGYAIFATVGSFYLPLLIMMIIYIKIWRVVKKRIKKKNLKQTIRNPSTAIIIETPTQLYLPEKDCSSRRFVKKVDLDNNTAPETVSNSTVSLKDPSSVAVSPLVNNDYTRRNSNFVDIAKVLIEAKNNKQKLENVAASCSPLRSNLKSQRQKLELKRERKAARTLGVITGTFIVCWLPFFTIALIQPFCQYCNYPYPLLTIINWLGYSNSLLNPIIYTIFNPDFRHAFRKILFGKYHRRYIQH